MNIKHLLVQVTLLTNPQSDLYIKSHQQKQQYIKLKQGRAVFLVYSSAYEIKLRDVSSILQMKPLFSFPNYQHNITIQFYEKRNVIAKQKIIVKFRQCKFDLGLIDLHIIKYKHLKKETLSNLDLVIKSNGNLLGRHKVVGKKQKNQYIFGLTTSIHLQEDNDIQILLEQIGFLTYYVGIANFKWNSLYPPNEQKELILKSGKKQVGRLLLVWLEHDQKQELDEEEREVERYRRIKNLEQNKFLARQNASLKLTLLNQRLSHS